MIPPARSASGRHSGTDGFGQVGAGHQPGAAVRRRDRQLRFGRGLSSLRDRNGEAHARAACPRSSSSAGRRRTRRAFHGRRLFAAGASGDRRDCRARKIANRCRRYWAVSAGAAGRLVSRTAALGGIARAAARARARARVDRICTAFLSRLDPAAAAKIHANDAPKLIRAIEVCLASRERMSELWQQRGRDPLRGFRILRIGLNPAARTAVRADQRARAADV